VALGEPGNDLLTSAGVQGDIKSLVEDLEEEDRLVPISGRLNQILLPESDRVMEESDGVGEAAPLAPLADPVKEEPDADRDTEDGLVIALPVADRVSDAKIDSGKKGNGGDGQMKFQLNLKALEGDEPRDTAVGAGSVGVMADAVRAKSPGETQVHALTGFGQEIMDLVDELEKDQ
jgi:hypothetical protein